MVSGLITDTASAGAFEFVSAEQAAAINTANALAPAAGGAASGFAAGGLQGGNLNSALSGAVTGGISGGISGYYGSQYPVDRIAANSVAGGVSSRINGRKFSDGFKFALATSTLSYANVQMRNEMVIQSKIDARNDGSGLSRGLFGDLFKLAGGRWNENILKGVVQCSDLGCLQSGPGSIFGIGYSKGGFVDMVAEAFAGPHDKANSYWFYNAEGLIKESTLTGASAFALEMATNYTTSLLFAAPFAFGAIAEQTNYSRYGRGR